jgi:steroid delta-isomerase-like uncharacterized protein
MPDPKRTRAAIEKIVVEHVEAENARDMARVMRTYAEGAIFEDVPRKMNFEGKEAIAESYQERFDAFPGTVRRIDRLTIGDEGAVTEITMSGEQTGVYTGLPPRPGMQTLRIAAHFQVNAEGLITRETVYYDALSVAVQLGVLPDLGSPAGRIWLVLTRPGLLLRMLRARLFHR